MINLNDNHKIISASIVVDGRFIKLEEKPEGNSGKVRCHSYTREYENYEITLRLDWKSLDEFGNPTLDADIEKDGKEYKIGYKDWHHTLKKEENGIYLYNWKPNIEELKEFSIETKFKLQTTNIQTISGTANIIHDEIKSKITKKQMKLNQQLLKEFVDKLK